MDTQKKATARPWETSFDSNTVEDLRGILNTVYALRDHAIEVYHVEASVEQSVIDRLVKIINQATETK